MNKMKIVVACMVLCCVFNAMLVAKDGNEVTPDMTRFVQFGDGSCFYEGNSVLVENQSGNIKLLSERKGNASGLQNDREEYNLTLYFDFMPWAVYVFNNDNAYSDLDMDWYNVNTEAQISIPEGTYDIIVEFFDVEMYYNYSNVIKEGVTIEGDRDLNIYTSEANVMIDLTTVDENWNIISSEDILTGDLVIEIDTPMESIQRTYYVFRGTPDGVNFNYIKQAPVSENYSFKILEVTLLEDKVYEATFEEYYGVENEMELENDPLAYRHSQAEFTFNPNSMQHYLNTISGFFYSNGACAWLTSAITVCPMNNSIFDIYVSDILDPSPSGYAFGLYAFMDEEPGTMYTPFYFLTEDGQQIVCSWHYPPANNDTVIEEDECVDFSMAIPYLNLKYSNNDGMSFQIDMDPKIYGSQNQWLRWLDAYAQYYLIYDEETIDSGTLLDFEPLENQLAGEYTLFIEQHSYYIENMQGFAEYNLTFNLTESGDSNPPYLTSLRIKNEEGQTVTSLPQNGNGTIEFTAADFIYDEGSLIYSDIYSAEVYYREFESKVWQSLPVSEESSLSDTVGGQYFIGDMSSITSQYPNGTYVDIKIEIIDEAGNSNTQRFLPTLYISSVSVDDPVYPTQSSIISSIGPNPFNDNTAIRFSLAKPSSVRMDVYNVRGEKVRTLVDEELAADSHTITWNGRDNIGKKVSSGIYFCKIKADNVTETRKMMLVH